MILEYLKWRGDLTFEESEFNKIDALIFSRISYIYFDKIVLGDSKISLYEALKKYLLSKDIEKRTIWPLDINLAEEILKCKRYKNIKLSNYVNKVDVSVEKQFSALLLHLNDKIKIVSFRGTDNTVIGWKEDFNMSFSKIIPAQIDSVEYLTNILKKYKNSNVISVGHSKGGNLAIYSSIFIDDKYNNRIIKIYNFDGPGFSKTIVDDKKYSKIVKKINSFIPNESIVGLILERRENEKIVKSNQKLLMQHDVYTWEIFRNDFIYSNKLSKNSKIIAKSISKWLETVDYEERKIFIDNLFDLIQSLDSDMNEIVKSLHSGAKLFIKSMQNSVVRDMLIKTIKIIYSEYKKGEKNNVL